MASGFPDYTRTVFTNASAGEQKKIAATAVEATTTFTYRFKYVMIYNSGPYTVHINIDDTATTNLMPIPSGAFLMIPLAGTTVHTICAAAQTATLYCWGFR